jgi:hypothetical protein
MEDKMIEVAMVAIKVGCVGFIALGGVLASLRSAKQMNSTSASCDLERFNYAVANDFETDFRRVHARRSLSRIAAA